MTCTHQPCAIVSAKGGFSCPCHGSQFGDDGEVTRGPAQRPLPFFKLALENAELCADFGEEVSPEWKLDLELDLEGGSS